MPLPTSQKALLDGAITRVDSFRATALAFGIEVDQVNLFFPPPTGDPDAPKTKVMFSWDVEANEFRVDT